MDTTRHKWICDARALRTFSVVALALFSLKLSGCSSLSSGNSKTVDYQKQMRILKRKVQAQKSQIEDLKERNMVLARKAKAPHVAKSEDLSSSAPARLPDSFAQNHDAFEPSKPVVTAPLRPGQILEAPKLNLAEEIASPVTEVKPTTTEHMLYSKILASYRARKIDELNLTLQLLLKSKSDSIFADNSTYLLGQLAFELGQYKIARQNFDRLIRDYPRSNKVVGAKFANAMIDVRESRKIAAKKELHKILEHYPGSPESTRAAIELQLLEAASSQSRGT